MSAASLDALQTFCGVGAPTLESAPANVKELVVGTFTGWFKALDDSFAFIFDSPGIQALAAAIDSFDKAQIYQVPSPPFGDPPSQSLSQ